MTFPDFVGAVASSSPEGKWGFFYTPDSESP